MRTNFIFVLLVIFVLALSGCGPKAETECEDLTGCEQFHCLFPNCWCDISGGPGSEIIYDSGLTITDGDSAKAVVNKYFQEYPDKEQDFYSIADLGHNWYNIFYGKYGDIVYTVGPDGRIYKTQCGV